MEKRRRPVIDGVFLVLLGVLLALSAVAWMRGGAPLLRAGLGRGGQLLLQFALVLVVSFLAAGLAEVLVPIDWVKETFGREAGLRGIVLATLAGAVTPAGPFTAMPLAAVFVRSGADTATVIAYLTGWSLLALHRLVAWEVPILGARFALARYGVSLVFPVLAGLLARLLLRA
jgi:uncharacterized membrane protein YraQ (UPF0718 family)